MKAAHHSGLEDPARAASHRVRRQLSWLAVVALACAAVASTLGQLTMAPGVAPDDQDPPIFVRQAQAAIVLDQRLGALRPHLRSLSLDPHATIGLAFLDQTQLRPASEAYHRVASRALAPWRLTLRVREDLLLVDAGPGSAGALPAAMTTGAQPWRLLAQTDDGLHLVRRTEP